MFSFMKKIFIAFSSFSGSLASMANTTNFATCILLNYQPWMTRPTLIDLNSDEYNEGLRYYPFIVNLDRCNGSYNILDDPSGRIRVVNETINIKLNIFNMITRINESEH